MENSFSIIIPAYNAEKNIGRCLNSVITQSYHNWELLVINDGSTDRTQEVVSSYMKKDNRIKMFIMPLNHGRLAARNLGMKLARNEWICWLDSDDEYMSNYLEVANEEINRNPDYPVFNWGMLVKDREIVNNKRYEKGWRLVEPLKLAETDMGMESFGKGKIGTGSFIFKRELLNEVGYFPETKTPYGLEDSFPAMWVKKDPMMKEICVQNEDGHYLPLGNPWGDDYSFFWYLTRHHKSKMINVLLYIAHIRI